MKLWGKAVTAPFCVAEGYGNQCAMAPIHLLGLFCTVCKGTYPFVGNALQAVQRHLSICQKRIARCAKVPIQLLEAHCKQCKGTYPIVGSTLQAVQRHLSNCQKPIANCDRYLHYAVNQEIKYGCDRKSVELRSKIISLKLIWIPALRSGRAGLGFNKQAAAACYCA